MILMRLLMDLESKKLYKRNKHKNNNFSNQISNNKIKMHVKQKINFKIMK